MNSKKIDGYTLVDVMSGLVCAFRRTQIKIYQAADRYEGRDMRIHIVQLSLEEIWVIEHAEAGRGPAGLQLHTGQWPKQEITSCLTPPP